MKISIITPSFNHGSFLEQAILSVLDQDYVNCEYIVVDGGSTDNTIDVIHKYQAQLASWISEKDDGMYDALNKGLCLASGDIIGHLNCDEQYMPETLKYIAEFFAVHPEVDIVFGDVLLLKPDGSLLGYRKAYQPRWFYIMTSHLYLHTCTMFFRRKILDAGFRFNAEFRMAGDHDFVVRLLRTGFRASFIRRYNACYYMTGENIGVSSAAIEELERLRKSAPLWIKCLSPILNAFRFIEKLSSGAYSQRKAIDYAIHIPGNSQGRKRFSVNTASARWRTR